MIDRNSLMNFTTAILMLLSIFNSLSKKRRKLMLHFCIFFMSFFSQQSCDKSTCNKIFLSAQPCLKSMISPFKQFLFNTDVSDRIKADLVYQRQHTLSKTKLWQIMLLQRVNFLRIAAIVRRTTAANTRKERG